MKRVVQHTKMCKVSNLHENTTIVKQYSPSSEACQCLVSCVQTAHRPVLLPRKALLERPVLCAFLHEHPTEAGRAEEIAGQASGHDDEAQNGGTPLRIQCRCRRLVVQN